MTLGEVEDFVERESLINELAVSWKIGKLRIEDWITYRQEESDDRPFLATAEELFGEVERTPWIIPTLLPRGEVVILAGLPKIGKTALEA